MKQTLRILADSGNGCCRGVGLIVHNDVASAENCGSSRFNWSICMVHEYVTFLFRSASWSIFAYEDSACNNSRCDRYHDPWVRLDETKHSRVSRNSRSEFER